MLNMVNNDDDDDVDISSGYEKGNVIVDSKKATKESGRNVEDIYNETAQYMASGGANDASFLEDEDYDTHDSCTYRGQVR
ncbi:hypothetical protein Tco_1528129 [Tanacetum coccineum]